MTVNRTPPRPGRSGDGPKLSSRSLPVLFQGSPPGGFMIVFSACGMLEGGA